jgi:hydrogenase maturation protein HypF
VNIRVKYLFSGIVQGVGFRPFIYRLAIENSLTGFVQNRSDGVVVEVQGKPEAIKKFDSRIKKELPPLANVVNISKKEIPIVDEKSFQIISSHKDKQASVHITPDYATCNDCLKELFDPKDRRYRYPFINCTNCGPRLTIIKDIPYDRINTSMSKFPLCPECRKEYEDPSNRRFHAEPNACPVCGPKLSLLNENGDQISCPDPIESTIDLLKKENILAIKGLGGFHLAVDATNTDAVKRLRSRKFREAKPFAIMVKNIEHASKIAELMPEEKELLLSAERPIVLVKKKLKTVISDAIAPGMANLGIMLPYTPLHHLLLEKFDALVMTSANQTDEPICIDNNEAVRRLQGIADFFLVHNRDILVRCDDSIAIVAEKKPRIVRRSRSFSPKPVILKDSYPNILALGGQLKNTICILKENCAFLSPYIGDMETPQARDFLHESISLMERITECKPDLIVCDLHPGYYTTQVAQKMAGENVIQVQHHHAHIVSCMAENNISGDVIGLSMDGTGYGEDGAVWGGEFLIANETSFTRAGHIKYFLLPGGEAAIHEPWRIAASLLQDIYGPDWKDIAKKLKLVPDKANLSLLDTVMEKKINSPYTSSLGRVFDAVSAILGLRSKVSFEGQAAMELEAFFTGKTDLSMPFSILEENNQYVLDLCPMIKDIVERRLRGESLEALASGFHISLVQAFMAMVEKIRKKTGLNGIALSGGCFQNRALLQKSISKMKASGFEVFSHHLVPTNDGGIALGQAVCAGARTSKK